MAVVYVELVYYTTLAYLYVLVSHPKWACEAERHLTIPEFDSPPTMLSPRLSENWVLTGYKISPDWSAAEVSQGFLGFPRANLAALVTLEYNT